MTFNEIVARTLDRLNLSSAAATTRIRERVNEAYKEVTTAIGLDTSRHTDTVYTFNSTVDTDLPTFEILGYEKIARILLMSDADTPLRVLPQVQYDEIATNTQRTGLPSQWAVKSVSHGTVTVLLDGFPAGEDFILKIDGYPVADELVEDQVPAFPESFHDVLIEHAMMNELRKMEKDKLAVIAQGRYEKRLSDLRYFLAKAAYLDVQQGQVRKYTATVLRNRNWY